MSRDSKFPPKTAGVSTETLHVSTVAIDGRAVLIEGPSGAGKSDLALRLIDRGAVLVSDDYTILIRNGETLLATAPVTIAGKIEVRGIGIVPMEHVERVPAALVVRLAGGFDRMPLERMERKIAGIAIPEITLDAHENAAPIKVELALRRIIAPA
ncbi:HPr kinase/phosphorylase [Sphingomonas alpina]|uniref:HPr kinase/phosphatase C-terminal domain-containing protein n=1 Tax=Sphingomonas alpina TaxID=653931 RepID=A0A7H0LNI3_9SPHN|nr:HPr kinase/phosphatase C-terminal domain-containing protein [Sphingomonas alpina]QNQ11236.1 HPr kinase/phosphatase C-terminal domain-containing protein [Sphingomonas alpina]